MKDVLLFFAGLSALEHLDIGLTDQVHYEYTAKFPDKILNDFDNLRTLRIGYFYPNEFQPISLKNLKKLKKLGISMIGNSVLSDAFKSLVSLDHLEIFSDFTNLYISDASLLVVPQITKLEIKRILNYMAPNALAHFTQLSSL